MIAGKKITEPPVITTVTPPTPAPGNLMACGGVKLFEFNIYTVLYVVDTFKHPNFRSRNRL